MDGQASNSTHAVMSHDPRDVIWNRSFETYYELYFYEELADRLIDRWMATDEVTKVLVALTATGSAVSGWALWQDADWKLAWVLLAGVATVFSIVHAALAVPGKIKDWEDFKRAAVTLRMRAETFRHRMEISPTFDIPTFTTEYEQTRKEYGELIQRQRNDILKTRALRLKTQLDLNRKLNLVEPQEPSNGH